MDEERFEEFSTLIGSINNNINKIKSRYISRFDFKSVHVLWIYLLKNHPEGLTASELATLTKTNRSLISREINSLVEKGIIKTEQKGEHRRYGWKFFLTEKGSETALQIASIVNGVQHSVDEGISEADLEIFYRTLNILSDNFENIIAEGRV